MLQSLQQGNVVLMFTSEIPLLGVKKRQIARWYMGTLSTLNNKRLFIYNQLCTRSYVTSQRPQLH